MVKTVITINVIMVLTLINFAIFLRISTVGHTSHDSQQLPPTIDPYDSVHS